MSHYLAFDLGAESGRAMLGTLSGGTLELEELHRFPNTPVRDDGAILFKRLYVGSGNLLDDHGNTVGFLPSGSASESLSSGSCRTDFCRSRSLSASD